MSQILIAPRDHEAEVNLRFDALQSRFKRDVDATDVRLRALRACLDPLPGLRVLDLGCGKGRFARRFEEAGASVVGLDLSAAMLNEAPGLDRVRGSARRLPFASEAFDAVIAVEVFEHLTTINEVLDEARRVLRPGGLLAIIDKNAGSWNAQRPWLPNLVVKWIDEVRGRWMYPIGGPVRERWFWPSVLRKNLAKTFESVQVEYLLSRAEADRLLFRTLPGARLMTLWTAQAPGVNRP